MSHPPTATRTRLGFGWSLATWLKVAVLASLSTVLMVYLEVPAAFLFPGAPFLKFDLSEVPALVGGFALGPLAGMAIVLVKNVLFLVQRLEPTQLIGVPVNTLAGATLVGVSSAFYWRRRTRLRAALGLSLGTLAMALVMIPANMLAWPLFHWLCPVSRETLWDILIYAVTPFNVLKGFFSGTVTLLVYKRISAFLKLW